MYHGDAALLPSLLKSLARFFLEVVLTLDDHTDRESVQLLLRRDGDTDSLTLS